MGFQAEWRREQGNRNTLWKKDQKHKQANWAEKKKAFHARNEARNRERTERTASQAAESQRKFNEGQREAKQRYEDFYNTPAQSWNPHNNNNNNTQSDSVRTIEVEEVDGGFLGGLGILTIPVAAVGLFAVGGAIYGAIIAAPVIAAGCATKLALKATNREGLNTLACGLLTLGVATGAGVGTYSIQREYTPGINEIQHTTVENINNWAQERMNENAEVK